MKAVLTTHLHFQEDIEHNGYLSLPGSSIAGSETETSEIEEVPVHSLFSRGWFEIHPRFKVAIGMILALISGLVFTFNGSVMKYYGIDPVEVLAVRGAVQFWFMFMLCKARGIPLWSDEVRNKTKGLMLLQGLMGGVMVIMSLISIMMIPLGDALTFIFSSPVFTCICSRIFLKHRLGLWKVIFIGLLILGITFVVQPPFIFPDTESNPNEVSLKGEWNDDDPDIVVHDFHYYLGALLAVLAAVIASFNSVCVSGTLKHIDSMVLVSYVGASSFMIAVLCTIFDLKQRIFSVEIVDIAAWEWGLIFGMAILGIFAYFSITKALQLIDPTVVSVLRSTEILLGFFVQVIVMNQIPNSFSIAGASIVFLSIIMIAMEGNIVRRLPLRIRANLNFSEYPKTRMTSNEVLITDCEEPPERHGYTPIPSSDPAPEDEQQTSLSRVSLWLEQHPTFKHALGLSLALVSGLIFTTSSFLIKFFNVDSVEAVTVRSVLQTLVMASVVKLNGFKFWPNEPHVTNGVRAWLVVQGLLGGIMVMSGFVSLTLIPLGDALTLFFSSPVFTSIFSHIVLGNRLKLWKSFFITLLICGVIFVVRPPMIFPPSQTFHSRRRRNAHEITQPHDSTYYLGAGLALMGSILAGVYSVVISGPLRDIKASVSIFYVGLMTFFIAIFGTELDDKQRIFSPHIGEITLAEWGALFLIAALGVAAYFCVTSSLQLIEPTIVSVLRALEIVFGFVIQTFIMGHQPSELSAFGAALVLISVIMISLERPIVRLVPVSVRRWL
eukprot:TCALIF_07231-PA protein Name:"Similar to SLC35G1 Solute carrier family 35 member G1 (Homo sapiens)" AED:0.22 eAED:0.23 QI:0/0/0/0.66/1/1/3/0/777